MAPSACKAGRGDHPPLAEPRHFHRPEEVEERNYDVRKNLLKYDDVVNDQRKAVFEQRQQFMESGDLSEQIGEMRHDTIEDFVSLCLPPKTYAEQWDAEGLKERLNLYLGLDLPVPDWAAEEGVTPEDIQTRIVEAAEAKAVERETPDRRRTVPGPGEELHAAADRHAVARTPDPSGPPAPGDRPSRLRASAIR